MKIKLILLDSEEEKEFGNCRKAESEYKKLIAQGHKVRVKKLFFDQDGNENWEDISPKKICEEN